MMGTNGGWPIPWMQHDEEASRVELRLLLPPLACTQ